jgi:hypothetical protein
MKSVPGRVGIVCISQRKHGALEQRVVLLVSVPWLGMWAEVLMLITSGNKCYYFLCCENTGKYCIKGTKRWKCMSSDCG